MKASILSKLERLQDRYEELEALLGVAEVIMDQDKFRAYSKEYAELENVVNNYGQYVQLQGDMEEAHLMLAEDDAERAARFALGFEVLGLLGDFKHVLKLADSLGRVADADVSCRQG